MKVVIALLLFAALANQAYAEKIRGIDLGDKCSYAREIELSLGSKEIDKTFTVDLGTGDTMAFDGVHDGQNALIMYSCVNSVVRSQLLRLKHPDAESAVISFQKYRRYMEPGEEIISISEHKGDYPRVSWKLKSGTTISFNTVPLSSSVSLSIIKQDLGGQL